MQRNRHNHHLRITKRRLQMPDRLTQYASEHIRSRAYVLILQQVNQVAESTFIASVGSRLDVGLLETPAQTTANFAVFTRKYMGRKKAFPANGAQTTGDWPQLIETGYAHR